MNAGKLAHKFVAHSLTVQRELASESQSYIRDRRLRTLLREVIDAGQAMHAALDCERAVFKIGLAEKQRRAKRWEQALKNFREAR